MTLREFQRGTQSLAREGDLIFIGRTKTGVMRAIDLALLLQIVDFAAIYRIPESIFQ
jgi:hypothetical protein